MTNISIRFFVVSSFALLVVLFTAWANTLFAQSDFVLKQPELNQHLPSLKNEKAVNYSKETNQVDSLSKSMIPSDYTQQARLATGTISDSFAQNVKISGNTAIVNSLNGIYVYVRLGSVWTQQAVLIPSDGAGQSIIYISGDTVVIGSPTATVNGNLNQGAAYVFVRNGTTWTQQQRLTASDGAADDRFGRVSISGDTILVGANRDDIGSNTDQGSAYIFVRQNGVWTEQAKLVANDGATNDFFGSVPSIDGDTAVVSTGSAPPNIPQHVYIFVRSGTTWTQQEKLSVCEPSAGNFCRFGNALAINGDTLVAANSFANIGTNTAAGAVYVFVRSGNTWTQQQRLIAGDGQMDDNFGNSVAVEGNTIVVGANAANVRPGSAYLFTRSGNIWTQRQKFQVTSPAFSNVFGNSVSISGNTIIVGAVRDQGTAAEPIGAAYIYTSAPAQRKTQFDFDGDGESDISIFRPSVGEWWISQSSTNQTVAAQFGSASDKIVPADFSGDGKTDIAFFRPSTGEWFILRSEDSSYYSLPFGISEDIPAPADFDGDGKADITVFRPSSGTWFISKSAGGTDIVTFGQNGDVPVAGDYDGDGKSDIAIFRPSNGEWWLNRSTAGIIAASFGTSSDTPVPGDYSGDGKTDIAIWRASTGEWFILRSEDSSYYSIPFGQTGDIPAPGDYDGDGKFDQGIFRGGVWYVQQSANGTLIRQFGLADDKPVPSAFVP